MKKLLYELAVEMAKRQLLQNLKTINQDAEFINSDFLDYHNSTCPRCNTPFKLFNNTVKNVGTLSGFVDKETKTIYLYAICKACAREITKTPNNPNHSQKAQDTENYIIGKLYLQ